MSREHLTLRRLVSRLEEVPGKDLSWHRATSILSTVKYAQGLLEALESHGGPSRIPAQSKRDSLPDLRERLDKLSYSLQAAKERAPRPEISKRAPLELRPALPQPPAPAAAVEEIGLLPVETDDLVSDPLPEVGATPSRPKHLRASTTQRTDPDDISSLLSHHREIQDELANDLAGMARQLKLNTLHFSSTLDKDKDVIAGLETRMEGNLTGMKQEKGRLGSYAKKGGTTTCFLITAVLGVTLAWSMMFLLIRIS